MARGNGVSLDLRSDWMRALAGVAVFLCFAGFVISLAGVAALQHDCGRSVLPAYWGNIGELGPMPCNKLFAYWWWKVFLEFGVLIAVSVTLALNKVHIFRVALAVVLGIATVLLMDATNTAFFGWYRLGHGTEMKRAKVFFSGTLILSVANFILIGILGTHDEGAHWANDAAAAGTYGGGRKRRDEAGAGAGGHAAAEAV